MSTDRFRVYGCLQRRRSEVGGENLEEKNTLSPEGVSDVSFRLLQGWGPRIFVNSQGSREVDKAPHRIPEGCRQIVCYLRLEGLAAVVRSEPVGDFERSWLKYCRGSPRAR